MKIIGTKLISVEESDFINGVFENNEITEVGYGCFWFCSSLTSVNIPLATAVGDWCFCDCQSLTSVNLPMATTFGNSCFSNCKSLTSVNIPLATAVGNWCFKFCPSLTSVNIPLATTFGNSCFSNCKSLTSVNLGSQILTGMNVDGYYFVIESTKVKGSITIYGGYNLIGLKKGNVIESPCYVAKDGEYTAHGATIKDAISDLQDKITGDILSKEPINADTIIDIERYHYAGRACRFGIRDWMESHGVKEGLTAKELLPILEKHQAYGLEHFKSLLTF